MNFWASGLGHPFEHRLHRRSMLGSLFAASVGAGLSLPGVQVSNEVAAASALRAQQKRVLFLWLAGGASQFEMWDPKPGRITGGPFRAIPTAITGYQISELMPQVAQRMQHLAVIRSLSTGLSEHGQAADLMSTGWPKEAALEHPEIGILLAKELGIPDSALPAYVSLFTTSEGRRRPETGFLSRRYAALTLEDSLRPGHMDRPSELSERDHARREDLRALLSRQFAVGRRGGEVVQGYNEAFARVRGLMHADHLFNLDQEPASVRDRYGSSPFGQHCLLARRLLEAGVCVVKVARGFWDSHHDNFESHRELVPDFDHVFSVLLDDLHDRGLLSSTLIVVLSEFGRTPKINQDLGRDHYADAWSFVLGGCGIRGGTVYGQTDADGAQVVDGKAGAGDVAATLFQAVGIDPTKHLEAGVRPVPLAKEDAKAISAVLA